MFALVLYSEGEAVGLSMWIDSVRYHKSWVDFEALWLEHCASPADGCCVWTPSAGAPDAFKSPGGSEYRSR